MFAKRREQTTAIARAADADERDLRARTAAIDLEEEQLEGDEEAAAQAREELDFELARLTHRRTAAERLLAIFQQQLTAAKNRCVDLAQKCDRFECEEAQKINGV